MARPIHTTHIWATWQAQATTGATLPMQPPVGTGEVRTAATLLTSPTWRDWMGEDPAQGSELYRDFWTSIPQQARSVLADVATRPTLLQDAAAPLIERYVELQTNRDVYISACSQWAGLDDVVSAAMPQGRRALAASEIWLEGLPTGALFYLYASHQDDDQMASKAVFRARVLQLLEHYSITAEATQPAMTPKELAEQCVERLEGTDLFREMFPQEDGTYRCRRWMHRFGRPYLGELAALDTSTFGTALRALLTTMPPIVEPDAPAVELVENETRVASYEVHTGRLLHPKNLRRLNPRAQKVVAERIQELPYMHDAWSRNGTARPHQTDAGAYYVLNILGDAYRLVYAVNSHEKQIYVGFIGTHEAYNRYSGRGNEANRRQWARRHGAY